MRVPKFYLEKSALVLMEKMVAGILLTLSFEIQTKYAVKHNTNVLCLTAYFVCVSI